MSTPFAQALHDFHFGQQRSPLVSHRDEEVKGHSLEQYFAGFAAEGDDGAWFESWLDGPLLDLGAGAGRHALYFQRQLETVAVDRSDLLVETMRDRGVEDARVADMFSLREAFERDRFRSVLVFGTQTSLARSRYGLRKFLGDLAFVTAPATPRPWSTGSIPNTNRRPR